MPKIDIPEMGLQLTGNGQTDGSFTVADPSRLKIGARVTVSSLAVDSVEALIDDVDVGGLTVYLRTLRDGAPDLSAFLVADEAFLNVPAQQLDYRFTEIDIGHVSTPIPVVVGGFPLPVGGATEATQLDVKTNTGNIASRMTSGAQITQVSNFPASQVVTAAALPLPSGASTEAKQDTGNSSLSSINTKTPSLGQAAMAASVPVTIASNQSVITIKGTDSVVDSNNSSTQVLGNSGIFLGTAVETLGYAQIIINAISDVAGTLQIQYSDDNSHWDHVLEYEVMAGQQRDVVSRPHARWFRVRYANGVTGQSYFRLYVYLRQEPQGLPMVQADGEIDGRQTVAVTKAVISGPSTLDGGHYIDAKVDPDGNLQVKGAITLASIPLPDGASTSARQDTGNSSLSSIDGKVATSAKQDTGNSSLSSIDGKVATSAKQDTGNSSLSSIDGKVATSAKQDTGNGSLSSLDGKVPSKGQALMVASLPVAIASNQSAIPASQSGTWSIVGVSGTVSLPTGAATDAKQDTGNSSLSSIDGKVATAAKQDTGNSSLSSIDGKVATSAKQDTGNSSLSSIDGKTPALGQAAMSGSVPVTIANNQSAVSVTVTNQAGAVINSGNSSTATLSGGATFTGTPAIDLLGYSKVTVTAFSDVASASNGLQLQFSPDGTNWDVSHSVTASAGVQAMISVAVKNRYCRVLYTNGASGQGSFRLQTLLHYVDTGTEARNLSDTVVAADQVLLTKGLISGLNSNSGSGYVDAKVNANGALNITGPVDATMVQNVQISAINSSVVNLNAGATFTGTGTSSLNVAGIQVLLKTDQDCAIWVDQSSDGNNWDVTDRYEYYAYENNFGITVQAVSAYFRVRVQNLSTVTTTYFRLSTCLCPVIEAVPRSLDSFGHLQVATTDMYNWDTGNRVRIDQFNALKTATVVRLVGAAFHGGTKDTNFWTEATAGTGSVAQGLGVVTLATGATANSTVRYSTTRLARFIAYATNIFRGVVRVADTGATNNVRRWGAFSTTSGVFFELSGTTLRAVTRYNSSDTPVAQSSWNRHRRFAVDTNFHGYEIWMGYQGIQFFIDGILVHSLSISDGLYSDTLNLPAALENNNSGGGTSNVSLIAVLAAIARLGELTTLPTSKNIGAAGTSTLKYAAGTLKRIVANKPGDAQTLTIYDNVTNAGTIIATLTFIKTQEPFSLDYGDLPFSTGLTIVVGTAGGAGVGDYTVVYE